MSSPRVKTAPPHWTPVPILMYHAVESQARPPQYKHFYVLADEFAGQMRMLKRAGYTPITFGDLEAARAGKAALPRRPVVLTFDDGYANIRPNVHPLLRGLGFPYTVFLVSERIGKSNDWVASEGYEPTPLLAWKEILEMQAEGGWISSRTPRRIPVLRIFPQTGRARRSQRPRMSWNSVYSVRSRRCAIRTAIIMK